MYNVSTTTEDKNPIDDALVSAVYPLVCVIAENFKDDPLVLASVIRKAIFDLYGVKDGESIGA